MGWRYCKFKCPFVFVLKPRYANSNLIDIKKCKFIRKKMLCIRITSGKKKLFNANILTLSVCCHDEKYNRVPIVSVTRLSPVIRRTRNNSYNIFICNNGRFESFVTFAKYNITILRVK